jgi:hypothetical protein
MEGYAPIFTLGYAVIGLLKFRKSLEMLYNVFVLRMEYAHGEFGRLLCFRFI